MMKSTPPRSACDSTDQLHLGVRMRCTNNAMDLSEVPSPRVVVAVVSRRRLIIFRLTLGNPEVDVPLYLFRTICDTNYFCSALARLLCHVS